MTAENVRERRRPRDPPWVWAVLLAVCLALGLGGPWWSSERAEGRHPVLAVDLEAGRAALAGLAVHDQVDAGATAGPGGGEVDAGGDVDPGSEVGRGGAGGGNRVADDYDRAAFGAAWADVDGNGCDTRNDVLRRDLLGAAVEADGCVVLSGVLLDPYTGGEIAFERGSRSGDVQIDHVVALAAAWRTGASAWPPAVREAFANDPANLLAVAGATNEDKGASDAAEWLPPDPGYRCVYVLRQVRVKAAYGLAVTSDEREAMGVALDRCVVVEG